MASVILQLFLAFVLLLAISVPANAEPITLLATTIATLLPQVGPLSLAAGAGFGFGTGTFAIAQGLATIATITALASVQALLAPRQNAQTINPGKLKDTFSAEDAPEIHLVGRGRVSGMKALGDSNGSDKYRLILHCKGTVDAVESYFVGGREVTVDADGAVSSPPWPKIDGSYLYLFTDLGDANKTAWSLLTSTFAYWTSDHRVRGIAQTLVRYISPGRDTVEDANKFSQLYQNGPPKIEVLLRGEDTIYDTRTTTSGWSENGILNALHILKTYPEFPLSKFDTDFISNEADRADILTARYNGGSTKRARCWGFWTSEQNRGDTMQQVLDSIGAWIIPRSNGSKLGIQLIDDDPTAETTVELKYIKDFVWEAGPAAVERPNICRVRYYSPERNYELTPVDLTGIAWARIESEITANGDKPFDVDLPFCPDAGQAQRIARRKFALARADRGVLYTNFSGMATLGCRVINIEFPDDLGTLKCLVGVPRILDDRGLVEIPFVVWPTLTAWNTASDEAAPPDEIGDLSFSGLTQPNIPSAATKVTYPDTSIVTRVGYTLPSDVLSGGLLKASATAEAVYRTYSGGLPNAWQSMTEYQGADGTAHAYVATDLSGQNIDFRVRTFDEANSSSWSNTFNVTVPTTNAAPSAPSIVIQNDTPVTDTATVTVTAPASLQVSYMQFTGPDAPAGDVAVNPGEEVSWTTDSTPDVNDYDIDITAQAFSSNDTGSSVASETLTVTGTGP